MSGHFDDEGAQPMTPREFRLHREAAGISDNHASLALAYALHALETRAELAPAEPQPLIQIGPLDV
ncbi:MAG TPA: hypothetical protein VGE36_04505 [Roseateles sp.]